MPRSVRERVYMGKCVAPMVMGTQRCIAQAGPSYSDSYLFAITLVQELADGLLGP